MKYFVILLILVGFDGTVFALEPESTNYFSNPDFQIYKIKEKQYEFFIPYSITYTKVQNIVLDCPSRSMVIYLEPASKNGTLTISIPRSLLDTKISENQDDDFFALVNGQEIDYSETEKNQDVRTLIIPFNVDVKEIEIIANVVIGGGPTSGKSHCGVGSIDESPYYHLLSPLKQFKSGTRIDQIQCKEGFAVVIKKSNGNPNCVKRETLEKLRERGWAEPLGDIVFQRHSQTKPEPASTPYSEPEPDYHFDKTFTLIGKKSQYHLDYLMPNGTITDIQLNCDSLKLVLSVSSTESGVLTLLLPEEIIGNIETIFVDKIQWNYISYAGNTVTIMIPENTQTIEIGGSYRDSLRGAECR